MVSVWHKIINKSWFQRGTRINKVDLNTGAFLLEGKVPRSFAEEVGHFVL